MFARVGLVLGGGGIVGMAYHAGVLMGLREALGWDPRDADVVVGTSAGAASGSELRAGFAPADLAARRSGFDFTTEGAQLMRGLGLSPVPEKKVVVPPDDGGRATYMRLTQISTNRSDSVRPGVLASVALPPGPYSGDWLAEEARWLHRGRSWPEADLWLCSVELETGGRVVFGSPQGPAAEIGDAVAASCAVPAVWEPREIGGVKHIDGGCYSSTNLDILVGHGLDLAIVLAPMCIASGVTAAGRDRLTRNAGRDMLQGEAAELRAAGIPVVVFAPDADDLALMGSLAPEDTLDDTRCRAVVRGARRSVIRKLARGEMAELDPLRARAAR